MILQQKLVLMQRSASVFSAENVENKLDNTLLALFPDVLYAAPDGAGSTGGSGAQGDEIRDESGLGAGAGTTGSGEMSSNAGDNNAAMDAGDSNAMADPDTDDPIAGVIIPGDPDSIIAVDVTGDNRPDVIVADVDGDGVSDVIIPAPMDAGTDASTDAGTAGGTTTGESPGGSGMDIMDGGTDAGGTDFGANMGGPGDTGGIDVGAVGPTNESADSDKNTPDSGTGAEGS